MKWSSPYQAEGVIEAFASVGIATCSLGDVHALDLNGTGLVAWELDRTPSPKLPWPAYVLHDVTDVDDATWSSAAYYTLLAGERSERSAAFRRKLRAGCAAGLDVVEGEEALQALPLFAGDSRLRGDVPYQRFVTLARRLQMQQAGRVFAAKTRAGAHVFCAVVLISRFVVNLRFTAVDRNAVGLQPARLVIDTIQQRFGGRILDLSGFTDPAQASPRAAGINRFKLDFGRRIANFRCVT